MVAATAAEMVVVTVVVTVVASKEGKFTKKVDFFLF
jgi:hypothetical protein